MVCLALELVGPCVVLGFSVSMEAFDEFLSINVPWSQEFPGVNLDLSLLLPVIGLIFTVVSKLLLLYSTIDKTEEHLTFNQGVAGPSPARPTIRSHFFGDLFV